VNRSAPCASDELWFLILEIRRIKEPRHTFSTSCRILAYGPPATRQLLHTVPPYNSARTHIGDQLARFEIVLKSKSGPPPSLLACDFVLTLLGNSWGIIGA
jgi:hypothetical protein